MLALGSEEGDIPPPECDVCGGFVRPGVVWFGESLAEAVLARAWRAAEKADVMLVVGTSALVHPAAMIPAVVTAHGGKVIEINPDETPLTQSVDVRWPATAGEALPALVRALGEGDDLETGEV